MGRVGVLALQGGIAPHLAALAEVGHETVEVRAPGQLASLDGLVLPGGESTTQWKLLERHGMSRALVAFHSTGRPILATCAGLILIARRVIGPEQDSFGLLDVEVARNGWGRQIESCEAMDDGGRTPLVFIRAPRILSVGAGVEVLLRYRGEPVLVQRGNVTAATFHPELTADRTLHRCVFSFSAPTRRAAASGRP